MTAEEMLPAAQVAIGNAADDDYKIRPTLHADELAANAPALASLLRKSELSVLAEQYELKDREANENQASFKQTANRANGAVLATACLSTLSLIVGPMKSVVGLAAADVFLTVGILGAISGGLGSMWVYRAREGRLLDAWVNARAAAETLRKQYFETIIGLVDSAGSPITVLLLAFEYFRRYQMDVQIAFYKRRAEDHRRDASKFLSVSTGSVALASASAAIAAILSGRNPAWVSIAALGTVATALASFAATKESVNQSRQNSERYTNSHNALSLLKRKLDSVRAAAAANAREPVTQYVAAVHDQIMAEHRQWLSAAQSIQPAIDKLQEALDKLKQKPQDSGAAAKASGQQT